MSRAIRAITSALAAVLAACGAAPPAVEPPPTGGLPPGPEGYRVVVPEILAPRAAEAAATTKARGDAAFLVGDLVYRGATAGLVVGELVDGGARYEERSTVYLRDAGSDVVVRDGAAFVACGPQGIAVIDVNDPRAPKPLAAIETPGAAVRLDLRGDLLLVADGSLGAAIVGVADPRSPRPIAAWRSAGYVRHAIFADDGAIYVAQGAAGVARLAFDGEALTEVWRLDTPGDARAVAVRGGRLYVADGPAGLAVIDVSGAKPAEVGRLALADMARDVVATADAKWAFVASGDDGVIAIDVSNPAAPALAGALALEKPVNRVRLYGDRLVLGNDSAGLAIVGVSEPGRPVLVFPRK